MTIDEIGAGSLKLVVSAGGPAVEKTLLTHVPDHHLRRAGKGAWIIFTEADLPTIRDWLTTAVTDRPLVFVVEFEHWSGHGDIDQEWLLRRGH